MMVCPKLAEGTCKITKKVCEQPYNIKMIDHKSCRTYKRGAKSRARSRK